MRLKMLLGAGLIFISLESMETATIDLGGGATLTREVANTGGITFERIVGNSIHHVSKSGDRYTSVDTFVDFSKVPAYQGLSYLDQETISQDAAKRMFNAYDQQFKQLSEVSEE